jgi:hypothetical protein
VRQSASSKGNDRRSGRALHRPSIAIDAIAKAFRVSYFALAISASRSTLVSSAAQGSRRTLDGQIHQGQTARGWLDAAGRSGNPAIWRSTTKIGMANLVYNVKRFIFLRKIAVA